MNNRSLAQNHLSSLANKGRYGDTEIAESKYVKPGSLWHVTKGEKRIMSRDGAEGEKFVDKIGEDPGLYSNTIKEVSSNSDIVGLTTDSLKDNNRFFIFCCF